LKDSSYEESECIFNKYPKHHMKMLLEGFNAKVGRAYPIKPTVGRESLHKISKENGVKVINFTTSKNLCKI
jgi:hypothetical protein